MKHETNRRGFFKTVGALSVGMGLLLDVGSRLLAAEVAKGAPRAEQLGWRLGCGAWTFRLFSLFEAIDKTASLGLHCLEVGLGAKFGKEWPNVEFDMNLPTDARRALNKKLADSGVKLVSYWPPALHFKSVAEGRRLFDFAKGMGIEMFSGEPPEEAFDTLEKLCDEYGMSLAVHNHPKPSHYWNPATVLKACQGRSPRIGACADTGHWARCGLNPVECIRKLEGRIISFHFKDLNRLGPDGHDVPWGTGVCDAKGMLAEVRRQGVRASFFVEYEYKWENNLSDIAQSVAYFDGVADELAAKQ